MIPSEVPSLHSVLRKFEGNPQSTGGTLTIDKLAPV